MLSICFDHICLVYPILLLCHDVMGGASHCVSSSRSGCVVLFVRENGSIAPALVLTVWLTRKTLKKDVRQVCTTACAMNDCYAFRAVELQSCGEDRSWMELG
jgi:hypothetical protein